MSNKENSFYRWFNEYSNSCTKTLNIPAKAIEVAGFNTKFPIYLQEVSPNHLGLTQDGSLDDIVGVINGWRQRNGKKTYRIGAEKRFNKDAMSAVIIPDKLNHYIDIIGVDFFG